MDTASVLVEAIRDYCRIDEVQENGSIAYGTIVSEYYPKVRIWLEDNDKEATAESIKENSEEISVFINSITLAELKESESEEEVDEVINSKIVNENSKKKTTRFVILIVAVAILFILIK